MAWPRLISFAAEHANLLRSLFEHRMEDDRPFPEDILLMVMQAFALMHQPLVRLLPGRNPEQVALLARTMFSAVHGIISLGLEERMVAVPPEKLRRQLAQFVDTHLAGLGIAVETRRRLEGQAFNLQDPRSNSLITFNWLSRNSTM